MALPEDCLMPSVIPGYHLERKPEIKTPGSSLEDQVHRRVAGATRIYRRGQAARAAPDTADTFALTPWTSRHYLHSSGLQIRRSGAYVKKRKLYDGVVISTP